MLTFFKENAEISRIKRVLALRGIFSETKYVCVCVCVLRTKFQVSSIILTSFRDGVILTSSHLKTDP